MGSFQHKALAIASFNVMHTICCDHLHTYKYRKRLLYIFYVYYPEATLYFKCLGKLCMHTCRAFSSIVFTTYTSEVRLHFVCFILYWLQHGMYCMHSTLMTQANWTVYLSYICMLINVAIYTCIKHDYTVKIQVYFQHPKSTRKIQGCCNCTD